jgi:hypothetical protein
MNMLPTNRPFPLCGFFVYSHNRSFYRSRENPLSSNDFISSQFTQINLLSSWDVSNGDAFFVSHIAFPISHPQLWPRGTIRWPRIKYACITGRIFRVFTMIACTRLTHYLYVYNALIVWTQKVIICFIPSFPIDRLVPNNRDVTRGSVAFLIRKWFELEAHTLEPNSFSGFLNLLLVTSRKWRERARVWSGSDPSIMDHLVVCYYLPSFDQIMQGRGTAVNAGGVCATSSLPFFLVDAVCKCLTLVHT